MAQDRYKYFRVEAREILDQIGQGALNLEKGAPPAAVVARLLRLCHTLKGAARVVKQREIAECAHALEDILTPCRDASTSLERDVIDRVLSLVDQIAVQVARLTPEQPSAETSASDPPEHPLLAFRPAIGDLDALLGGVFEAHVRLGALRPRLAQVERARHVAGLVVNQLRRPWSAPRLRAGREATNEKACSTAEDLRAMIGVLERDLSSNIDRLDRELRQVREAAERLRLSPASALFTFLERAVRDVANALGKRVAFDTFGGDVRVDPSVLALVQSALLHVVRNAVAHGIEAGDGERIAAGKPPEGRVTLRVSQHGRQVSFTCADDGRGIDLDAVRRIAQRKGLVLNDGRAEPEELLRVLLKGGISTSRTVTDLSGRGIGLDVVREAVERLGGAATARTEAGKGTTIDLVVPLSVASFPALVVESEGRTAAIPLDAVRGALRLTRDDLLRTEQGESVIFEGHAIPVASLPRPVSPKPPSAGAPRRSAVVVQGRAAVAAFTVDRIAGTAQIVMRPLSALTPASGVVAGATLDAVGDPLLVFDPDTLVAQAQRPAAATATADACRLSILVVDDSLTTRMLEQSILESAGYDVELATSGEEALSKARIAEYALFLVDVEMPGMDGFALIARIRADPTLQHIPAILVTSRDSPEDRRRGQDVGAQAHIVKSEFDQGILLERIRALAG